MSDQNGAMQGNSIRKLEAVIIKFPRTFNQGHEFFTRGSQLHLINGRHVIDEMFNPPTWWIVLLCCSKLSVDAETPTVVDSFTFPPRVDFWTTIWSFLTNVNGVFGQTQFFCR
jgi:hypothetical protein